MYRAPALSFSLVGGACSYAPPALLDVASPPLDSDGASPATALSPRPADGVLVPVPSVVSFPPASDGVLLPAVVSFPPASDGVLLPAVVSFPPAGDGALLPAVVSFPPADNGVLPTVVSFLPAVVSFPPAGDSVLPAVVPSLPVGAAILLLAAVLSPLARGRVLPHSPAAI